MCFVFLCVFFFFKQKTAYEMRISDWSSDVCSSDLAPIGVQSVVHPDGELATARAAEATGVPMVLSTASSYTIEEAAEANGDGQRWFQLYWPHEIGRASCRERVCPYV